MSEKRIKVTDRRMFDADGNLREEFEELADAPPPDLTRRPETQEPPPAAPRATDPRSAPPAASRAPSAPQASGAPAGPAAPTDADGDLPQAGFQDLVGLLAQSASMYLQQAAQRQVQGHAEVLDMARMHVDLLVVLQQKTSGNLDTREAAMLDDIIYRLRMALVEVS